MSRHQQVCRKQVWLLTQGPCGPLHDSDPCVFQSPQQNFLWGLGGVYPELTHCMHPLLPEPQTLRQHHK